MYIYIHTYIQICFIAELQLFKSTPIIIESKNKECKTNTENGNNVEIKRQLAKKKKHCKQQNYYHT